LDGTPYAAAAAPRDAHPMGSGRSFRIYQGLPLQEEEEEEEGLEQDDDDASQVGSALLVEWGCGVLAEARGRGYSTHTRHVCCCIRRYGVLFCACECGGTARLHARPPHSAFARIA
jgi:hypothetical protein